MQFKKASNAKFEVIVFNQENVKNLPKWLQNAGIQVDKLIEKGFISDKKPLFLPLTSDKVGLDGVLLALYKDNASLIAKAVKSIQSKESVDGRVDIKGLDIEDQKKMAKALVLGVYNFTQMKSKVSEESIQWCIEKHSLSKIDQAWLMALGAGVSFAKDLGNLPPNICTPKYLGDQALGLKDESLNVVVHDKKVLENLGMGALLAVAKGSKQKPVLIELNYNGAGNEKPVVLVGKGITFDSGGISIKPSNGMEEMKFDMMGAASVLGVFKALKLFAPKINVVGLVAACENMPSGNATKPGDIVTSMSGKTIEIINTDAEGRLVLCDCLTYAKRFEPRAVVDIATLTGACVVALGSKRAGLYSNKKELSAKLFNVGEKVQDWVWQMPLDDEYAEGLKSKYADLANLGKGAGSILGAKFLQEFVDYPWAHLDIAGVAWGPEGATGRPVDLLFKWVLGEPEQNS